MTTHWPVSVSDSPSSDGGVVLACASCGQILVTWSRKAFFARYSEDSPGLHVALGLACGLWCFNKAAVLAATDYLLQVVLPVNHFIDPVWFRSGWGSLCIAVGDCARRCLETHTRLCHRFVVDLRKNTLLHLRLLMAKSKCDTNALQRACRQKALSSNSAKLVLWMALHRPRGRFRQRREQLRIKSVTNI